jgi:hypothetical protein
MRANGTRWSDIDLQNSQNSLLYNLASTADDFWGQHPEIPEDGP